MSIELTTIKYEGPKDILAWKHPTEDFLIGSQLIVHESQEALFMGGGEALDLFGPGRHTLKTDNIPYVEKWYTKLFGMGKKPGADTPFHCEVYFVNKTTVMDILWGTPSPIPVEDPRYGIIVPVRANGQFAIRIADSRKFLVKLVGTTAGIGTEAVHSYFKGMLMTRIKDYISNLMVQQKISFLEVHGHLNRISEDIRVQITEPFAEYGVEVANFFVNSISVPEDDPGYVKIRNALAAATERGLLAKGKRAEMDTLGFNWQQEQAIDVLKKAAQNEGTSGSLLGAGMGLGMGAAVGGVVGNSMAGVAQNLNVDLSGPPKEMSKYTQTNEPAQPEGKVNCPSCGLLVVKGKHCMECGAPMEIACSSCKVKIPAGSKFCPECGNKV